MSGNEETVKPILRQSSDYIAGVPIKKRRFPLIHPTSPPSEERSSFPSDDNSVNKEQSSPSPGSALSISSVITTSGLSDANKNFVPEGRGKPDNSTANMVQSNIGYSRVKLEEPSFPAPSSYLDRKEGPVVAKKSGLQTLSENTELKLAPGDTLLGNVGKVTQSKMQLEVRGLSEISMLGGNTELSLCLKEDHIRALAGESNQNCKNQEHLLQKLSLNPKKSIIGRETADVKINSNGSLQQSNRANWDLNTTMDSWEGCASDVTGGKISTAVVNTSVGTHDRRPLILSTGMVGTDNLSGKQTTSVSVDRTHLSPSYTISGKQDMTNDYLNLSLSSSSLRPDGSRESSSSSVKSESGRVPNLSLHRVNLSSGSLNIGKKTVKEEPVDGSMKIDFMGAEPNQKGLSDGRTVKHEISEQYNLQVPESSNVGSLSKLANPILVKSDLVQGGDDNSSAVSIPVRTEMSDMPRKHLRLTELTMNGDSLRHFRYSSHPEGVLFNSEISQEAGQATLDKTRILKYQDAKENGGSGTADTVRAEVESAEDHGLVPLELMNERPFGLQGNEGSVSDEEKINISTDMLEDDPYSSGYESDGNQALGKAMHSEDPGVVDNEYEDGEVRESLGQTKVEDKVCEKTEVKYFDHGDSDDKKTNSVELPFQDLPTSSHHVKDHNTQDPIETLINDSKNCVDTNSIDKAAEGEKKDVHLEESFSVEVRKDIVDIKRPINTTLRRQMGQSVRKEALKNLDTSSAMNESQVFGPEVSKGADEKVEKDDSGEQNGLSSPNGEESISEDNASKEANGGSNRSRIINLTRASTTTSPGKTKSIPVRPFPTGNGRERLPDVALEGGRLHPRGRDDLYGDGHMKFSRDRNREISPRNSRMNFMRGRGRFSRPVDMGSGSDWDMDRSYAPEIYRGPTDYHGPRHNKYRPTAPDADVDYNGYNVSPDSGFPATARGGRKPLNDEGPIFHQMPSRRRSPGGRDGPPPMRGNRMGQGILRYNNNNSPSRCIGEDSSEFVRLRHNEKFSRGFSDDNFEPMIPPFEGDGHFGRGNRSFSSLQQRRGPPRIQSKSPIRGRNRSPGPWMSPPRRRSPPNVFDGHLELNHRRSPPIYRVERMRSPDRSGFRGEMVSPSFISRPNGRLLLRNNRRVDHVMDDRERTESDEYLGGPIHSDGNGNERRSFDERRGGGGPVRSFRPSYNNSGANGESYRMNAEDGPGSTRPFRFCPEDNPEFHERGSNLREKEFDRRIKSRAGHMPRRPRSIEAQEVNRHGGQLWHDDGFDGISRLKRKRF